MKSVKRVLLGLAMVAGLSAGSFAYAGAMGGPQWGFNLLNPFCMAPFSIAFNGNQMARVCVQGNGATDLDIFVYDQFGNVIASDTRFGDYCEVYFWVPFWQTYTVHVVNRGALINFYAISTN